MSEYEALRQRHVADAMALTPRLIDQLDWPAGRLAAHRTRQLRELVRAAAERSPWYRKRLADVDIDRLDETTLAGLPVLTKTELMEHFDDIVTDRLLSLAQLERHLRTVETGSYLFGRYTAITSSGSTGQRGVFVLQLGGVLAELFPRRAAGEAGRPGAGRAASRTGRRPPRTSATPPPRWPGHSAART